MEHGSIQDLPFGVLCYEVFPVDDQIEMVHNCHKGSDRKSFDDVVVAVDVELHAGRNNWGQSTINFWLGW